jgi:hypothetical protein
MRTTQPLLVPHSQDLRPNDERLMTIRLLLRVHVLFKNHSTFLATTIPTIREYRLLIATYMNVEAAAEGMHRSQKLSQRLARKVVHFVGQYYFKYESPVGRLDAQKEKEKFTDEGLRNFHGIPNFPTGNTHAYLVPFVKSSY